MNNLNAILRREERKLKAAKNAIVKFEPTAEVVLSYEDSSLLQEEEMFWDCRRRSVSPYELEIFSKIIFVQDRYRTGLNKNNFTIYTKDGVIAYIGLENSNGAGYIYSVMEINSPTLQEYVLQTRAKLEKLKNIAHTFTGEILISKSANLASMQSWDSSSSQYLVKFENGKFISETPLFVNDYYASQGWATCEYVRTDEQSGKEVDVRDYPNRVEISDTDTNAGSWKSFTFQGKVVTQEFFQNNLSYGVSLNTKYKALVLGYSWN